MTIVICKDKCSCGVFFIKNPHCSGDYYPTHIGIVLQRFCPQCGKMLPIVTERDINYISNNNKKRVLNHIARTYNKRFKELSKIYYRHCKEIDDRFDFIKVISRETGLSQDKILPLC